MTRRRRTAHRGALPIALAAGFAVSVAAWGIPARAVGAVPALNLNSAVAEPGGTAVITVTLARNGNPVAGTSNDLRFDSTRLTIDPARDCTLHGSTAPGFFLIAGRVCTNGAGPCTADADCTGSNTPPCNLARLGVVAIPTQLIPQDGPLITCTFSIGSGTPAGIYEIANTPDATNTSGVSLGATGSPGTITVLGPSPGPTTPPGTPSGTPTSPTATPTPTRSPSPAATHTPPPTGTASPTNVPSPSPTEPPAATTTATPAFTPTATPSSTSTVPPSATPTATPTAAASVTPTRHRHQHIPRHLRGTRTIRGTGVPEIP